MSAIDTFGRTVSMINHRANSSSAFILFLTHLVSTYRLEGLDLSADSVIIVDNSRIHKSEEVLDFMREANLFVVFLPEYSPVCVTIELFFSNLKQRVKHSV